jgi:hypothetical protein
VVDDGLHVWLVEACCKMRLGGSDTNSVADTLTKWACTRVIIQHIVSFETAVTRSERARDIPLRRARKKMFLALPKD